MKGMIQTFFVYHTRLRLLKTVLIFIFTLFLYSASAQTIGFKITNSSGRTTFSFKKVNNLIIIPVTLNNALPLNFILDTGVRTTILTDRTISDLVNISYDKIVTISGVGHIRELNAYLAGNISLNMPGIEGHGQSLIVLEEDYLELRSHLGTNVHGIIGYEFFNHFVIKIDYINEVVTVYDPEVFKPGRKFAEVPFTIEQGRPYITVNVTQHNDSVLILKLLIDSGASHGLLLETDTDDNILLPDSNIHTVIGWGLGGELTGNLGRVKKLSFENFEFKDVLASFTENYSDKETALITGRNGSIGGDLLSRFTAIFDYNANKLYLRKNIHYNYPFEFNMSGIDLIAEGINSDRFVVVNVVEGSPAHMAGVCRGDEFQAVNGKYDYELNLTEINGILRSRAGNKINLVIKRENQRLKVSFRLKRMI